MARESSIPHILSMLRIILHLSFAALLSVGIVRTFLERTQLAPLICILLTAAFTACLYFVGTFSEIRFAKGESSFDPRSLITWWLASILVLWAGLTLSSESFVWVSFPLFFLVIYAWPPIAAAAAIVGMITVIACSSVLNSVFTPGVVIGPIVGAIVAVTISAVYAKLVDEAVRTRAAFEELRAAQAKLALSQQQEGRLAERQKVAAEFHDTIAQSLLSIVLIARAGQNRSEPQALHADLGTIENTAAQSLTSVRGFLAGEELGGSSAEAELAEACTTVEAAASAIGTPLRAAFSTEGTKIGLAPSLEYFFSRAGQSLLSNALLHSEADYVSVTLHYWGSAVSLDVVDNGRGFAGKHFGYGLNSLSERTEELGGSMTLRSTPGSGTEVSVFVPITGDSLARPAATSAPPSEQQPTWRSTPAQQEESW
ncbi:MULTISPECIES: sensor histidine kinase [unclassified Brevibacterium]|uniref:sensor histidine kinase n=1 Tax=unclassified Brevibacterium TaxID=2614124 RepID=UPI0008B5E6B4|nr:MULTISPECIES: ATP-binding protein [unclassified Brevibacterium]OFS27275.1 hypothetical protein HMPREF3162_02515 [Brevibacterium sp. HMSC07C04]